MTVDRVELSAAYRAAGQQPAHRVRRRTGDDPIEIAREALCHHERFASAVGTPDEICLGSGFGLEFLDDSLRRQRGFADRTPAVILNLLFVIERPTGVDIVG